MKKEYEYWLMHEDELERLKCIGRQEEIREEKKYQEEKNE